MGEPGERITAKEAARRASRAAMLDAATSLLLEARGADPVASLRPGDVAARAQPPRTTGAFYNIWPTQEQFRKDVVTHVLSLDRFRLARTTIPGLLASIAAEDFRLPDVVRFGAEINFAAVKHEPAAQLKQALWIRHHVDDDLRAQLGRLYATATDELITFYETLLRRSGRKVSPPYTIEHLTVTISALLEGMFLRWAVQPEAVPDDLGPPPGLPGTSRQRPDQQSQPESAPASEAATDEQAPWSLFASTSYLIFMAMTEPA